MNFIRIMAILLVLFMVVQLPPSQIPTDVDMDDGTRAIEPGTIITDDITSSVTWDIGGSPYNVKNSIVIKVDANLTIDTGVVMKFSKGAKLYVAGTLDARGKDPLNPFNKIWFKPDSANPAAQDWEGIVFMETSKDCVLDTVHVSFASGGVNCSEGTSPVITNSIIAYSHFFAIYCGANSTPLIQNCDVNNSLFAGILCDNKSMPIILDNHINTCWHGIIAYSGAQIRNNFIELCAVGILAWNSSSIIADNTVSHCHDGIFIFFCSPLIEDNLIRSCAGNGTRFIGSNSTFTNNRMEFNDVGVDIPYDSKNVVLNMSGNSVNGIPAKDLYYIGLKDSTIEGVQLSSGQESNFTGLLTNQGSITLYDCHDVIIDNCNISYNMNGVYAVNSTFDVYNSKFYSSRHGDLNLAESSNARSYNGSVNETRVMTGDDCYFVSYGSIQVQVKNYTLQPVQSATVEVRELSTIQNNNITTDALGFTETLLVKKIRVSSTGLFHYTMEVEVWSPNMTFDDNPRSVEIDDDVLVVFTDLGDIIPPEIVSTNMVHGDMDVAINSTIQISFSEPMNRTSVEEAFTISNNVTGTFQWTDNDLTFIPSSSYDYLTYYVVTMSTEAMDLQGNQLKDGLVVSFTTEPARSSLGESGSTLGIIIVLVVVVGIVTLLYMKRK